MHVALSVRGPIARANMRLLIKANGFFVLHNCMNLVFKELTSSTAVSTESPKQSKGEDDDDDALVEDTPDETLG